MFKELSFCKSQIPQPEKHEVRGLGAYVSIFLKLCGFTWRKRNLTLIKFAHTTAKAVTILLSWKYCPDNFVFKEQTEGEGFGEGFEEGLHTEGRAQGRIAGLDHSDASLKGGGDPPKSRILLDWWLNQPPPRRSLHNRCFICISYLCFLFII